MLNKALGRDFRHELIGAIHALPPAEAQREREGLREVVGRCEDVSQ